ncbi:unnamed protein product [Porites lobata]|uniref:G-protein coupled receptors family 1 profile domain-containing protein n=1 Tax=Porites lobata TaxID=104759 RepID=A0ABN8MVP0_9CNID|nr:unnamed protein product [Porites lobata]
MIASVSTISGELGDQIPEKNYMNTTWISFKMSDPPHVAITIANSILIVTCISGNCFVCVVLLRNRDMRIPFNYLLVNLAAADISYATFAVPNIILSHHVYHPEGLAGTLLCTTLTGGNLSWAGGRASMITLLVIAIERYFAVVHPHGNKGKLTNRKLKVVIPGIWIIAIIYRIPSAKRTFDATSHSCVSSLPTETKKTTGIAFRVLKFFLIALLVVLYSRVVYALWFKPSDDVLKHQQRTVLRLRKRVTLMVVSVSAIFVISWGGDTVLHILEDRSFKLSPLAIPIAHVVIMFNAAVNPFAYALINERFRQKMKEMMCSGSRSLATKHFVTSARALHKIPRASVPVVTVTLEEQMSKGDVTRDDSQQRF